MKLKVATYNIKHGSNNGRYISQIANLIKENDIDIIGLQELDLYVSRSGKQDVLAEIAKISGYKYYHFFKTIDYQDGEYGLAILSKHPFTNPETIKLSLYQEARVLGKVKMKINNKDFFFLVTHLDLGTYEDVRKYQFAEVAGVVKDLERFILTGDFNVHDWTDKLNDFFEYEEYLGMYNLANNKTNTFLTFSGKEDIGTGILPLDNIITSRDIIIDKTYLIDKEYSDHDLLIAEVEI